MRLNSTGSALYGVGVTHIYVDGVAIPSLAGSTANTWSWLTDLIAAGQADFGGGYHLYQVIIASNTLSMIATSGYTTFAAGGGNYGSFLAGTGVTTNVGGLGPFPLAAVGDVSREGLFAFIQNYASGTGVVTFSAAGTSLSNTSVTLVSSAISARNGIYSYRDAAGMHLRSLSNGTLQSYAPRTGDTTFQCVPIVIGGVTYVVEAVGAVASTLSLRPATSSTGFLVASGDTFNVDVCSPSAGVVRIGWCINAGESQTSLRMADITLATGGVTNWTTASGSLVSSAGTPIPSSPFTVGPVEGGTTKATKQPRQAMLSDGTGFAGPSGVRQYQAWWDTLAGQAVAGANAAQMQGIVDPAHGGTGVTTGLTVLNGANIIEDTIPLSALVDETASTLLGRGQGSGDGDTQQITLGTGLSMTGTVLSSSGTGSSWVPMVTGAEPPVFVTDGAGNLIFVAYP